MSQGFSTTCGKEGEWVMIGICKVTHGEEKVATGRQTAEERNQLRGPYSWKGNLRNGENDGPCLTTDSPRNWYERGGKDGHTSNKYKRDDE